MSAQPLQARLGFDGRPAAGRAFRECRQDLSAGWRVAAFQQLQRAQHLQLFAGLPVPVLAVHRPLLSVPEGAGRLALEWQDGHWW